MVSTFEKQFEGIINIILRYKKTHFQKKKATYHNNAPSIRFYLANENIVKSLAGLLGAPFSPEVSFPQSSFPFFPCLPVLYFSYGYDNLLSVSC